MKVVINADYGGFSLSDKAVEECIKEGMKVTDYGSDGMYVNEDAEFVKMKRDAFNGYYCCKSYDKEFRINPILVKVVKKLGKKANGACAELKIIDIPYEGVEGWHIEEYDGAESIHADHASWC